MNDKEMLYLVPGVCFLIACVFFVFGGSYLIDTSTRTDVPEAAHHLIGDGVNYESPTIKSLLDESKIHTEKTFATGGEKPVNAAGKAAFALCISCHGDKGQGVKAMNGPAIAGQEDWYLKTQLLNFKAGIRGSHKDDKTGVMMKPFAAMLDDKKIDDVIDYISTLSSPAKGTEVTTLKGDPVKGKALYTTCVACHGANAKGNPAMKSPNIRDQHDWYILTQLKYFKSGARGSHKKDVQGSLMAPMAKMIANEKDMKDIIAYIKSLK